jgi:hypothetical protein
MNDLQLDGNRLTSSAPARPGSSTPCHLLPGAARRSSSTPPGGAPCHPAGARPDRRAPPPRPAGTSLSRAAGSWSRAAAGRGYWVGGVYPSYCRKTKERLTRSPCGDLVTWGGDPGERGGLSELGGGPGRAGGRFSWSLCGGVAWNWMRRGQREATGRMRSLPRFPRVYWEISHLLTGGGLRTLPS